MAVHLLISELRSLLAGRTWAKVKAKAKQLSGLATSLCGDFEGTRAFVRPPTACFEILKGKREAQNQSFNNLRETNTKPPSLSCFSPPPFPFRDKLRMRLADCHRSHSAAAAGLPGVPPRHPRKGGPARGTAKIDTNFRAKIVERPWLQVL